MTDLQHLVIAGLPNPVSAALTSITAGAEGSTMQADRLKNGEPDDPARLTSVFPHESWWAVDFKVATLLRALSLHGHSLVPGDLLRVVGVNGGSLPDVRSETLPPTAIEADTNLDPAVTDVSDIDEHPSAADATTIGAEFAIQDWDIRLSFGTPSAVPAVGAGYQCFLLAVETTGLTPGEIDNAPLITAHLYENGVFRADPGTKVTSNSGPQTLIFPWDAGDLATPDGSQVEVLLSFTAPNAYARLDAVSWECVHQADVDAADFDTGWEVVPGAEADTEWGSTAIQTVDTLGGGWSKLLAADVTLTALRIEFKADGAGYFEDFQFTPPRKPAGSIDAGVLIAAPLFHAPYRFAPGGVLRVNREDLGGASITGSNRSVTVWRQRECEIVLPILAERTAHLLLERLARVAGIEQSFLVALEPGADDPRVLRNTTFLAYVAATGQLQYPGDGVALGAAGQQRARGLSFTLAEKL